MTIGFVDALTLPDVAEPGAPFVVLMGWVNSQDKYLAKYSQLLSKHGYPSLRTIQPTSTGFAILEGGRRRWAADILTFVSQHAAARDRPLVLWSFSNGGCWVFEQVTLLLEEDSRFALLQKRLAGLIFDSCPAYMHFSSGARAMSSGAGPVARVLLQAAFAAIAVFTLLVAGNTRERFWQRLLQEQLPQPRLYLYSADDDLCDVSEVEALIQKKRSQGLTVHTKRWERSGHCAHLRHHPEEYTAAVLQFLETCVPGK